MTDLRLPHLVCQLLTDADLNSIEPFFLHRLHLGNLAAIDLDYRTRNHASPLVPEVSAANLVSHQACALTFPCGWFSELQIKLLINFLLKALERLLLVFDAETFRRLEDLLVVQSLFFCEC